MKKSYVKPELFYESFVLAQHIAGCNLSWNNDFMAADSCTASGTITDPFGSMTSTSWFVGGNGECQLKAEGYCYTNGSHTIATINS